MCDTPPKIPSPPLPPLGDPPEFPPNPPNRGIAPQIRPRGRARTRLRNRRFAALQELLRGGEYFSEEQMRLRAPALFHHYIGRFRHPRAPKTPQTPGNPKSLLGEPQKTAGPPQNLRELLLRALEESPAEAEQEEEEEEEEDEDDEGEDEERVPDAAEQELLRLEFTSRMYQSFLEGQDGDFDYSQVDENPDLDDLELLSRDLEDRYFDEEEPSQAPVLQ